MTLRSHSAHFTEVQEVEFTAYSNIGNVEQNSVEYMERHYLHESRTEVRPELSVAAEVEYARGNHM